MKLHIKRANKESIKIEPPELKKVKEMIEHIEFEVLTCLKSKEGEERFLHVHRCRISADANSSI